MNSMPGEDSEDETLDDDNVEVVLGPEEEILYNEKLAKMKDYLPTLHLLREKCLKDGSDKTDTVVQKLDFLYSMFCSSKKKLSLSSLTRCEDSLRNIAGRLMKLPRFADTVPSGFETPPSESPNDPQASGSSRVLTNDYSDETTENVNKRINSDKGKINLKKDFKRLTSKPYSAKNESVKKRSPIAINSNHDSTIKNEPSHIRSTPEKIKKKHSPIRFIPEPKIRNRHSSDRFSPEPEIRMKRKHSPSKYDQDSETFHHRNHLPFRPSWIHEGFRPLRPIAKMGRYSAEQKQYSNRSAKASYSHWINARPRHPISAEFTNKEDKRIVVHTEFMDDSILRTTSVYSATSLKRSTTVERNTSTPEFNIKPSISTDLNLNDYKQSEMHEKDQDTLNLQKSEHNIKVLMENRFANLLQLSKLSSSVKEQEIVRAPLVEVPTDISPFSSALDEMMSNLNSRNKSSRCQLAQIPPMETDKEVLKKMRNEPDRSDKSKSINTLILEKKKSSIAPSHMLKEEDFEKTDCARYELEEEDKNTLKGTCEIQTKEPYRPTKEQIKDKTLGSHPSQNLEARVTDLLEYFRSKGDTKFPQISEPLKEPITEPVKVRRSSILELPFPLGSTELNESIYDKRHEENSIGQDKTLEPLTEKRPTQPISSKSTEEPDVSKPNQSLRAKLSEEISTLHKVGLPYGGALRGLINRDKMMPPGRLASLKPGTVIDLIQEEKPQRPTLKHKNKPHTQTSSSNSMTNIPEPVKTIVTTNPLSSHQQRDTNEILSKMSESDLKQLIHKNIGDLAIPPILSCFGNSNIFSQELSNQNQSNQQPFTWNTDSNSMKQVSIHAQNVIVNNINVLPTDYNNIMNSVATHQQSSLANESWLPNQNNDSWRNSISPNDPRRGSLNVSTSNNYINHNDLKTGMMVYGQIEYNHKPLDIPTYSSTKKSCSAELMKDTLKSTSYSPPVLQTDPFMSPCYDGSSTPDPYRPDPYTQSIQENLEKQEYSYNSVALHSETTSRPPLLETPPMIPYSRDGKHQRPSISGTPPIPQERDNYHMYSDNQPVRSVDQRNVRYYGDSSYSAWKERRHSHLQANQHDYTNYYDRVPDGRRNFKWSRESHSVSQFDHRGQEYANRHHTEKPVMVRPVHKEPEMVKKLAPRDPRRKSVDESSSREESLNCSSNKDFKIQDMEQRNYKRDSRRRDRSPSRDRARNRERYYSGDGTGSSSKGRAHISSSTRRYHDKQNVENSDRKLNDKRYKNTYTSPLDDLYRNTATPKTGLGYGIQKFRIPKLNRNTSENSKVKHVATESKNEKKDSFNTNENKKCLEDLEAVTSTENPIEAEDTAANSSCKETFDSDCMHNVEGPCNKMKLENVQSEKHIFNVNQSDHSSDGQSPKMIADEKAEEIQSSSEDIVKVKSQPKIKVNDNPLIIQNNNQSETSKKSQKEGETNSCRRSARLSLSKKVYQGSKYSENSTDIATEDGPFNDTSVANVKTETEPKSCDSGGSNKVKTDDGRKLKDKNTLKIQKIQAEEELKDTENHTETDIQLVELNEPNIQSSTIHDIKVASSTSEQSLIDESECLLTSNSNDKDITDKNEKSSNKDNSFEGIDNLNGNQSITQETKTQEEIKKSSSLENECAMDLSVKKNIEDEGISTSCDRKTISNPLIATGHHTKQSTYQLQIEKGLVRNSVEVPTVKSARSDPDVKSLTQLTPELLKNVFGITLTAEKIKKVAELLSEENCGLTPAPNQSSSEECKNNQATESSCTSGVQSSQNERDSTIETKQHDSSIETKQHDLEIKKSSGRAAKGKSAKKKKPIKSKPKDIKQSSTKNNNQKQKRKYKNELDRLQDDISKYHDSEAIAAASGLRLCRLQKEKTDQLLNNTVSQQGNKKKTASKKIMVVKEESPTNSEGDSDSGDSFILLSEKLKSKYEPLILEGKEQLLRREQKLKEEADKLNSTLVWSQDIDRTSENQIDILDSLSKSEKKDIELTESEITEEKKRKQIKYPSGNAHLLKKEDPYLQESLEKKSSTTVKLAVDQTKSSDPLIETKTGPNVGILSSESFSKEKLKEEIVTYELLDEKSDSDDEHRHKNLSNNILSKYGFKKQRKKCFWKAGVIKKKSKPKKLEKLESFSDICNQLEGDSSFEADSSYDSIVPEADNPYHDSVVADENYFQEGESRVTNCKLCPFSGKAIVSHYAITHPKDEVLISRMSQQAADAAVKESKIFFRLDNIKKQERSIFECRICYQKFLKFSVFFEHMALHTGEFRHECCKCGYRTCTRSGILKHYLTHNVKTSTKTSCRILYKEPPNRAFFCGYLCALCNFFQISQSNVKRHIENIHNNQDVSNIIKINLSKLSYLDSDLSVKDEGDNSEKDTSSTSLKLSSSDCDSAIEDKIPIHSNRVEISPIRPGEIDMLTRETQDKNLEEKLDGSKTVAVEENVEKVVEGCFELSFDLENHAQFIEAEVCNSYKQKCIEAVAAISTRKTLHHTKDLITTLELKQNEYESDPNNICTLQSLIGKKRKEKTGFQVENETEQLNDQVGGKIDEILPTRRQLPERSCKSFLKSKSNENDNDISVDETYTHLFEALDEPETEDSDSLLEDITLEYLKREKPSMLFESQLDRCTELTATEQLYEPKIQIYVSSLPINSNLSEFTHVMQKISNSKLKLPECEKICVGGLKVTRQENEVVFSCSLKLFNKQCEFQSSELVLFGQHINVSHHHSFWDGTCGSCFVVFIPDSSSHDKATLFTQSKAFCHLVREHLSFIQNSPSEEGESTLKKVSEVRPMLRVRRLSGDKLSMPGPHSENSLAHQPKEAFQLFDATPESTQPHSFDPPTSSESLQRKEWTGLGGRTSSLKIATSYTAMCEPNKLRNFYKCMGAKCAFTTSAIKTFLAHIEHHIAIYEMYTNQDPHNKTWQLCSYCLNRFTTSMELAIHLRKEHAECTLQCAKCFYRSKSLSNVHFHHMVEHIETDFVVLQCEQWEQNLPPFEEKPFTDFVLALRCSKVGCNLFTYMLDTFCNHLISAHKNDLCCYICSAPFTCYITMLEHYRKSHGIGMYQCLYCIFGTDSEYEIRLHLCYKHPNNIPKAIHRTEGVSKSNSGPHNRESLKRIVFHKDEAKLLKYVVPVPECESTLDGRPLQAPHEKNLIPSQHFKPQSHVTPNILRKRNPQPVKRPHPEDSSNHKKICLSSGASATKNLKVVPVPVTSVFPGESFSTPSRSVLSLPSVAARNVTSSAKLTQISSDTPEYSPINIHASNLYEMPVVMSSSSPSVLTTSAIVVSIPTAASTTSTVYTTISSPSPSTTLTDQSISPHLESTSDNSDSTEELCSQEVYDENYFKCGNRGCRFEAGTSTALKNHLVVCDQARQSQRLECAYCQRLFKQATSLLDHLRSHGPPRFSCTLCAFKAPLQSRVNSHMKSKHHVSSTILMPADSLKQDPEKDLFLVCPKEKRGRGADKTGLKGKREGSRTTFSPEELEEIPPTAIFPLPLGCSLCSYRTKVRSNLMRHVYQHASGKIVSQEEVVNPVPEKTEKMFDKMMNLAGSSHQKKSLQEEDEVGNEECKYKFVPSALRYMCHLKECGYRTHSETMLRSHVTIIHKDETSYMCPHCPEDSAPVPIDQLGLHLKLHDSTLFKCSYCSYHSHVRRTIDRHQISYHWAEAISVQVLRINKSDVSSDELPTKPPVVVGQPDEPGEDWYACTMCSFRTKKKKAILSHGLSEHKMTKPFKCSVCNYESPTDYNLKTHFTTYHPEETCEVVSLYKKITEVKKPVQMPIPPLWKRDAKKIKLIRGIKLDEKGDAPAPVATCVDRDVSELDILELKFGAFGRPSGSGEFVCPRCSTFKVRARQEMREHLFKDLEYKPLTCTVCKISGTQKTKMSKHINKSHGIEWCLVNSYMEVNCNEDVENWVDKVLSTQAELMKAPPSLFSQSVSPIFLSRKRRRSSPEVVFMSQGPGPEVVDLEPPVPVIPISPDSSLTNEQDTASISPKDTEALFADEEDSSSEPPSTETSYKRDKKKRDKCPSRHRFSCYYCNITTKYRHSIIIHTKKNHPNMRPQIVNLTRSTHMTDAFNCMYCNCTAIDTINLKLHWALTHRASGLDFLFRESVIHYNREYECYYCKKITLYDNLEEHCKQAHPEERFLVTSITVPKYKCSECKLVFNSVDILKRHFSMDHPSKQFCYIVLNAQRPTFPAGQSLTPSDNPVETFNQTKKVRTYKCFNCHFVSSSYWQMIKHMKRHFFTYACSECDSLYLSAFGIRKHKFNKHPGSQVKPLLIKGSNKDIENAKRNIIIISESGRKRQITEEELAEAETEEDTSDQNSDLSEEIESLEEEKGDSVVVKETARKSTGSPRKYPVETLAKPPDPHQQQRLPSKYKRALYKVRRKKLKLSNTYVTVSSQGKNIKLSVDTLTKLVNFDVQLSLDDKQT